MGISLDVEVQRSAPKARYTFKWSEVSFNDAKHPQGFFSNSALTQLVERHKPYSPYSLLKVLLLFVSPVEFMSSSRLAGRLPTGTSQIYPEPGSQVVLKLAGG